MLGLNSDEHTAFGPQYDRYQDWSSRRVSVEGYVLAGEDT